MKKVKIVSLLLAMCMLAGLTGCTRTDDRLEKQQALKQEGMNLQASGDFTGAIEKYEEALKLSDMKVTEAETDIAYYKASAQYRLGDIDGAIDTYSNVLALKKDVNGHLGRGILYMEAKEAKKAEEDLNYALNETKDPLIKGIIFQVVGETEKAKENFEKAKEDGNSEAVFYLAGLYEKAGDSAYGMILLEEYLEGEKASAEGYLRVGRNYFESGAYSDALKMFQDGIAQGESGVLKNLMQEEIACYERLGDFASAREKAAVYLEKYPEDAAIQKEYEFLKSR